MLPAHKRSLQETLGRSSIHPFPARMAAGIALHALGEGEAKLRVLDPMAGSGTVPAVARAMGHRAFGYDIDPLAVLLARVWTRPVDAELMHDKAAQVLDRSKKIFGALSSGAAYPIGSDEETRKFVRYWFDDYARRQLSALAATIHRVQNDTTRELLWCAFSRLIITKSAGASLAMDLSHSRPHKVYSTAPVKPFNKFISAVKAVASNCPQVASGLLGPTAIIKRGDARNLDLASDSIDLVLTSPPYLNAIDYMRCSKFSLVWMGHPICELRRIRGSSIGAETSSELAADADWVDSTIKELGLSPKLSARSHAVLANYVWDMGAALAEVGRVLKVGGRAVYVVGDSTVRGTFVRNSAIVAAIGEVNGLTLQSKCSRGLPANRRYLPPPKRHAAAAIECRIRREFVLQFCKRR